MQHPNEQKTAAIAAPLCVRLLPFIPPPIHNH
jgi:hypothetical protein